MVVASGWRRPTRWMIRLLAWAVAPMVLALAVLVVPVPTEDATVAWGRLGLAFAMFAISLVPLGRFLWLAAQNARFKTLLVLDGIAWKGQEEPAPPFTPSSPRRQLGGRVRSGSLPSCRVWVVERPRGDATSVRVLLASVEAEGSQAVEASKTRLARWLERHPRPASGPKL